MPNSLTALKINVIEAITFLISIIVDPFCLLYFRTSDKWNCITCTLYFLTTLTQ